MKFLHIVYIIFAFILSSCSIFPSKMEGTKIEAAIVNKTLIFSDMKVLKNNGIPVMDITINKSIYFKQNNTFLLKDYTKNKITIGIWHHVNNELCLNYNGDEECGELYESDGSGVRNSKGGCDEMRSCVIGNKPKVNNSLNNGETLRFEIQMTSPIAGITSDSGACIEASDYYQTINLKNKSCTIKYYNFNTMSSDKLSKRINLSNSDSEKIALIQEMNNNFLKRIKIKDGDFENLQSTYEEIKNNNRLEAKKSDNIIEYLKFLKTYKSDLEQIYKKSIISLSSIREQILSLTHERSNFPYSDKDFFDIYILDTGSENFENIYMAQLDLIEANKLYQATLESKNIDDFESLVSTKQKKYFLMLNNQQRNNIVNALKKNVKQQESTKNYVILYKMTNDKKYINHALKSIKTANDEYYLAQQLPDSCFKIGQKGKHEKGDKTDMLDNFAEGLTRGVNGQNSGSRINGLTSAVASLYLPVNTSNTKPIFDVLVYSNAKYGTYKVSVKFVLTTHSENNTSFLFISQKESKERNYEKVVDFIISPKNTVTQKVEFSEIMTHGTASLVGLINSETKVSFKSFKANIVNVEPMK